MEEVYRALAERNGWSFSMDERPYFMKDGKYATPDETTSEEDKDLLATIISEGSLELKKLILLCWNHKLKVGGPCSGIKEFHNNIPRSCHFALLGPSEIIEIFYERIHEQYPEFEVLYRKEEKEDRLDIDYLLEGKELTTEQANILFAHIRKELESTLEDQKESASHK